MNFYIGTVMLFAGDFAPRDWAFCDGRLLPIAENQTLFSLLGTTYGGDGVRTFALPDLRGRAAVGTGTGPGLDAVQRGEADGAQQVTLTISELPAHSHMVKCDGQAAGHASPMEMLPGTLSALAGPAIYGQAPSGLMASTMIAPTGGSQPVRTQSPYLGLSYIIALAGIYPSRS